MRKKFEILALLASVALASHSYAFNWPSDAQTFEAGTIGNTVTTEAPGWVIAGGGAFYTAVIASTPAGQPGQFSGSTKWLTVTDTDSAGSNRVYSGTITAPSNPAFYTYSFLMNVDSIAAGTAALLISQQGGSLQNLGGLELTDSGMNVIIVGTDDGGIGKAGASARTPLYAFADSGGFGTANWVNLSFTIDFALGEVRAQATGSNGATTVNQTLTGLSVQGGASLTQFRLCLRNNAAGHTSTIHYDNVAFVGSATSAVEKWSLYE